MADEIELKLDLTCGAADALEISGLLAGNQRPARQVSIYFDTPDRCLSKSGLSLRIRRTGRKRVQTIKANGATAAGLFARSEWERPVKDDTPLLDDSTPIRAVLGGAADTLARVFEVRIDRRTWLINENGATIELVLDRGDVVAGERLSPVCELELELKHGDPEALFDLARKIDATVPVRLGVLTKAERGYRLTGPLATECKAEPVVLNGEMTAGQALRRIVQSCVRQFRLNETMLLVDRNPKALHQARVALRRLRSAVSIFNPVIGDSGGDLSEGLRWLGSTLGDARNLDVLLERARPHPLRSRIATAREAAYARVGDALSSPRARQLMIDIAAWTAKDGWATSPNLAGGDPPVRDFAVMALDRFHRKVKKKGRDLLGADDEARHEVRKDAKKLRYAAEFFASLFERKARKRYGKFVVALEALQNELGALNDLRIAPQVLEMLGVENGQDSQRLMGRRQKKKLIEASRRAYARLFDVKRFW